MDRRRALLVDAFADEPLAGNAAGVVPDADGLSEEQMVAVANELGASETAFFHDAEAADRRIRYFTPETEVDLCGHATIASHYHLYQDGVVAAGTHSLETNVGVLAIDVEENGTVWMTQGVPEVEALDVDRRRVADVLGIGTDAILDDLPIAWGTTGLPFIVVPVAFLEQLGNVSPDMAAIEALADEFDATGIYAFTFDTLGGESTLHGRMFAPGAGVPEDPVTGTASGVAGAYLRHADAFEEMPEEMVFEQGHYVDRPGRVRVRVGEEVQVGGQAVTALDGEVRVPEYEDDEIIEA